ncbi:Pentatricopeptide repeat-containing protein, mitochondrial [Sesamum angolense]|uniref:Pentatricopeptide repeat-containing protein, mitochondrial n=1 Tax=Sesamum angolense TaxID=2727404 RepID=A0AAE2BVC1_9LAMI|nr:Pentatricopeptide repeat-containing protein, mitochondrial [Sesamum angolense]
MPEKPNSDVWAALLSSCRLHGEWMLKIAADELFKISNESRPGAYVALSNTLAEAGRWDSVSQLRELMKVRGISKGTGFTWVGLMLVWKLSTLGSHCDSVPKLFGVIILHSLHKAMVFLLTLYLETRSVIKAFGVSLGSPLRLCVPSSLPRWRCHLDRRDYAELLVSVLLVRDGDSRIGVGTDQGSVFCNEVVH